MYQASKVWFFLRSNFFKNEPLISCPFLSSKLDSPIIKTLERHYSNQSQFMGYQEWDEILMITLISSKKLGGYRIMRHTVQAKKSR